MVVEIVVMISIISRAIIVIVLVVGGREGGEGEKLGAYYE